MIWSLRIFFINSAASETFPRSRASESSTGVHMLARGSSTKGLRNAYLPGPAVAFFSDQPLWGLARQLVYVGSVTTPFPPPPPPPQTLSMFRRSSLRHSTAQIPVGRGVGNICLYSSVPPFRRACWVKKGAGRIIRMSGASRRASKMVLAMQHQHRLLRGREGRGAWPTAASQTRRDLLARSLGPPLSYYRYIGNPLCSVRTTDISMLDRTRAL